MLRLTIVALSLLGFFGCGSRAAVPSVAPDAGGDAGSVSGRRSFDVTATLGAPGPDAAVLPPNVSRTRTFTLVLDADEGRAIVGGNGRAAVVPFTSPDGRAFHIRTGVSVGDAAATCGGGTELDFEVLDFTVNGTTLQGTASGQAVVSCGDCQFNVPFTATLAGGADTTPPLLFVGGAIPTTPFDSFALIASEPLPATATASLTLSDGSHVDLVPTLVDGTIPVVTGFSKPDQVLPLGGLAVASEGLVDFAGLRGSADAPLRLAAFAAAPLLPEDGFESATAPQVGGAVVIVAGTGALPPIAGTRSVYIGGLGAPSPDGRPVGTSLRVRLAVQPGDTKVRFSYRVASQSPGAGFGGAVHVGSVGHTTGHASIDGGGQGTGAQWPGGGTVYVEDVSAQEIVLPADVTDEIVVDFESPNFDCGFAKPTPSGLLIDDLQVE